MRLEFQFLPHFRLTLLNSNCLQTKNGGVGCNYSYSMDCPKLQIAPGVLSCTFFSFRRLTLFFVLYLLPWQKLKRPIFLVISWIPQYVMRPPLQFRCHYIVNYYVKLRHVRLGSANNMRTLSWEKFRFLPLTYDIFRTLYVKFYVICVIRFLIIRDFSTLSLRFF